MINKRFVKDFSLTFLTGIFIAAGCLSIGVLINGDSRMLFVVNMLTFALSGHIIKKHLSSIPLILGIVLLSIPYALYYSTQITVTPRIIVFPIFNTLAIAIGYYFKDIISNVGNSTKIAAYIVFICIIGWFLIPSVSSWISIKETNKKIPKFEVISLDGKKINNTDLQGKIVIIDFWATWCAPCIAELKELEKFQTQFKDNQDVVLLVINEDDGGNMELAKQFAKKRSFNLPFYVDSLGMAYSAFEANAYPALYVIDKKSNIKFVKSGFNPSEDLVQILINKIREIDM
ncbi:MAG: TlpA family protein disulfide reductase [Maribacter sp.]|nr:TlpA family protein disulfide reductase [Maribacter sp.]